MRWTLPMGLTLGLAILMTPVGTTWAGSPQRGDRIPGRQSHAVAPLFRHLLPRLHGTHVPLLLPKAGTFHRGYADLLVAHPGRYIISMGYVRQCDGSTACDLGTVAGRRLQGSPPLRGVRVTLARGITGYFRLFQCGASCDESTLRWNIGKYRYNFGLKAGERAELVRMANSAILAGPA